MDFLPSKTDEGSEWGAAFILGFLHTPWNMLTSSKGTWSPLRSLGVLWGGVSKQENKCWVIKKRERIWRGPKKLLKEQQRPLICPVGPFTNDKDNNHFQWANYFLDSVLVTLCALLLIYITTLQVRTVHTKTLQAMPLSPIENPKCREVIELPWPSHWGVEPRQWSRSMIWGRMHPWSSWCFPALKNFLHGGSLGRDLGWWKVRCIEIDDVTKLNQQ